MADIDTDLPKIKVKGAAKPAVKPAAKADKPKVEVKAGKPATKKPEVKKPAAKADKPKADAKPAKANAPAGKKANAPAKADKKPATKATKAPAKASASKPAAKPAKGAAVTADAVATKIAKLVASGKVEAPKGVDYASDKSVVDALSAKAATVLLKAYSDKNVAAITHADNLVAKAAKAVLTKNAAAIRNEAVASHAKKFAGQIVKVSKDASAGKLNAAAFKQVAFAI
ncbi:hypothetical protein [Rhizobium phage RHph_N46]|nr:hypothetical protein EVC12_220 [Rhizobium phage RHph_I42]QXV73905.1 hypothetical protein [Rhizobium phage RHph_N46]